VWYWQDLRILDNPAFYEATKKGRVLALYIYDNSPGANKSPGEASKIWLHHSLLSLDMSLERKLNVYEGKVAEVFSHLLEQYSVKQVYCNLSFEPTYKRHLKEVFALCKSKGVEFTAFNANYLWHPSDLTKSDGDFYKVYTPFKNNALKTPPRKAIFRPKSFDAVKDSKNSTTIRSLDLLPKKPWVHLIENCWEIGEQAALKKLSLFIKKNLSGYRHGRDFPAEDHTSKLSPHLHFGEISPAQIYEKILQMPSSIDKTVFINELVWREYSTYLLHFFPHLEEKNFNPKFNAYPWKKTHPQLKAWQTGNTGYPFIDAAMKELWQTGYMHNRARMVVASFLVKNLHIHWHQGRDWFWDCLVDADLASNSASWQWVAGCGVDAAPFFRIFNPVTQGEKFDKEGEYVKRWIPELKNLPVKYIHAPWTAPEDILLSAGVRLGKTYPYPIVDLSTTRLAALGWYKSLN